MKQEHLCSKWDPRWLTRIVSAPWLKILKQLSSQPCGRESFEFSHLSAHIVHANCRLLSHAPYDIYNAWWIYLSILFYAATWLSPIVIASFSCKLSRANPPCLGMLPGRVALTLLFGIRYAFIVHDRGRGAASGLIFLMNMIGSCLTIIFQWVDVCRWST